MADVKKMTIAYRPADIAEVPAIDELLTELGVGTLRRDTIKSVMGRNNNWIGTTETDCDVFIKQLNGPDCGARLDRSAHIAGVGEQTMHMPRLLGVDIDEALIALEFLPDAQTAAELARTSELSEEVCAEAGRQIAHLHRLPPEGFDVSEHPLPPVEALDGLFMSYYVRASAAELDMWRLLQHDVELTVALREMRRADVASPEIRTPIHGDLRLDQFLVSGERLYLSDFEEARLGDPARDIGAFAGEWLFLAAAALPSSLAESLPVGKSASHAQIVATGVSEIERRNPLVRAFLRSYLDARPEARDDLTLIRRATSYAGWHMLDRMLAGAGNSNRLSAVSKAAAGIGRTLLLTPEEFTSTLGLDA
jgi:aminoglycoside phosphotransferase (APT) family kinase protein